MLYLKRLFVLLIFMTISSGSASAVDVDLGASIKEGKLEGFYLAIEKHYDVSDREIKHVRAARIGDEELPVVFFLAQKAKVRPSDIIMRRLRGHSWMDITLHFGLHAEIYHVAFERDPGPPYGRAYGHYKKHERKQWSKIRLDDEEIINWVNLRFLSDHYRWPVDEVAAMRGKGHGFADINSEIKKARHKKEKKMAESDMKGKAEKKGNEKNKKK